MRTFVCVLGAVALLAALVGARVSAEAQVEAGARAGEAQVVQLEQRLRDAVKATKKTATPLVAAADGDDDYSESADMYVLAQSWQPEFCYGHEDDYPGCSGNQTALWNDSFTLHGLWPQYSAGGYPADCTDEAFDAEAILEENGGPGAEMMYEHWPNVQDAVDSGDYTSFWEHEWTKHGTCAAPLAQPDYYTAAIDQLLKMGTPSAVVDNIGGTVSKSDLQDAYGGAEYVALQCSSGSFLSGAYSCWSKNSDATVGSQIQCPDDVVSEDTCTSDPITITSF